MNQKAAPARAYTPKTFSKVIGILTAFSYSKPELTTAEIAKTVNLSPSTLSRYLTSMEQENYIMRVPNTNRYRVGLRVVELSAIALCCNELRLHGEPVIKSLSRQLSMTANIAVLYGDRMMSLVFEVDDELDAMHSLTGLCSLCTATAIGKTALAYLPLGERQAIAKSNLGDQASSSALEALELELEKVRKSGYAVNFTDNVKRNCLAAPVFSKGGAFAGSMSVSTDRYDEFRNQFESIRKAVCEHASFLSAKLGYFPKPYL